MHIVWIYSWVRALATAAPADTTHAAEVAGARTHGGLLLVEHYGWHVGGCYLVELCILVNSRLAIYPRSLHTLLLPPCTLSGLEICWCGASKGWSFGHFSPPQHPRIKQPAPVAMLLSPLLVERYSGASELQSSC